ncbi:MAG: DNA polymerase III subunit delta [Bacillota bacterium]|nr:DNA polymerase III subunit delta [Bacillota bacterium]
MSRAVTVDLKLWAALRQKIRRGEVAPVYLLEGPERFLKDQLIRTLEETLATRGTVCCERLEGGALEPERLSEALLASSIFDPVKLVLLEDLPRLSAALDERLAALIPRLPPSHYLVLLDDLPAQRGEKKARSRSAAEQRGERLFFRHLYEREAIAWLAEQAHLDGFLLSEEVAAEMVARVGTDLGRLRRELDKLETFLGQEKKAILLEHVEKATGHSVSRTIFALVDALGDGNGPQALDLARALFAQGESPVYLLSLLARQFYHLLLTRAGQKAGLREEELAAFLGHPAPFLLRRYLEQVRHFPASYLEQALTLVCRSEYRIKAGLAPLPEEEVYTLLSLLATASPFSPPPRPADRREKGKK